jgi:hypothetical protein
VEHHGNHSVAKASKWQSVKTKITCSHTFCGWLWVEYNQIWKCLLIHSYHFHPDDRGSKFLRSVCYMHENPKCHIQENNNLNASRRESITVTQRIWYCRFRCTAQKGMGEMRNGTRILPAWILATSCKK